MFQDIYPHRFDNQFKDIQPEGKDRVLCYSSGKVALKDEKIPSFEDGFFNPEDLSYAFSLDEEKYFVLRKPMECFNMVPTRDAADKLTTFAAIMGLHLYTWYEKNHYCGICKEELTFSKGERALVCPKCGNVIYPRISPVVIVGVTNGDEILLTKYADRDYARYALIAGFMEYGETPEDTVRREVFEEAGLKVKNITYYKSQPWPYPDSLLLGFYAEVDGDTTATLRDGELKEATWFKRKDVPDIESDFALTSELMENFKNSLDI
ncbi:MAG: NAD(+) diphosphatase [Clostridia bacterium]|nr:NAD(+) diphosphatase [Clostridia bacterium]